MGLVWEIGEVHTRFQWGGLRAREYLEGLGIDGRIILKWIFKTWLVGGGGMDCIDLAQDWNVAGAGKRSNEPSVSIKCGEFLA
jgi:hypothetical protein